jgi:hypothetical protein
VNVVPVTYVMLNKVMVRLHPAGSASYTLRPQEKTKAITNSATVVHAPELLENVLEVGAEEDAALDGHEDEDDAVDDHLGGHIGRRER